MVLKRLKIFRQVPIPVKVIDYIITADDSGCIGNALKTGTHNICAVKLYSVHNAQVQFEEKDIIHTDLILPSQGIATMQYAR